LPPGAGIRVAGIEICRASFVSCCQAAGGKALAQDSKTPTYTDASHIIALISVAIRTDAGAAVRTTAIVSGSIAYSWGCPIIVAGVIVAGVIMRPCSICC
jgi:hypothetical protein